MINTCLLAGGDIRQRMMATMLLQKGVTVYAAGLEHCVQLPGDVRPWDEAAPPVDLAVLPVPATRDGTTLNAPYAAGPLPLNAIIDRLPADCRLCGGMVPPAVAELCREKHMTLFDYGKEERFLQQNALLTAEGAIEIALRNTSRQLEGTPVCVVGYGRIGRILANKLQALGCRVTVAARRPEARQEALALHMKAIATNELPNHAFAVLFNTAPAPVIDAAAIAAQPDHCLLIDLASPPGGVDKQAARRRGLRHIHALALPARCAPASAADIIWQTIAHHFEETD